MAQTELILDARDIHAWYGSSHVLHGVALQIAKGETVGLLGRNGMGKSTLIRSLLGHVAQRQGQISLFGRDWLPGAPLTWSMPLLLGLAGLLVLKLARRQWLRLLDDELARLPEGGDLPGAAAFKLYDTYGFPLDLTQDALREKGRAVDTQGFDAAMAEEKASILPEEITPAHMRGRVRLLVFWNSGEGCFHVPDPGESGYRGELISRPLGSLA